MATSGLRGYLDTQKSEFLREVRHALPFWTVLHCTALGWRCESLGRGRRLVGGDLSLLRVGERGKGSGNAFCVRRCACGC